MQNSSINHEELSISSLEDDLTYVNDDDLEED